MLLHLNHPEFNLPISTVWYMTFAVSTPVYDVMAWNLFRTHRRRFLTLSCGMLSFLMISMLILGFLRTLDLVGNF